MSNKTMCKEDAIEAMANGMKLTHTWFSPEEWMTMQGGQYVFEDGAHCSYSMFWQDRTDESWNTGWIIFEE